MRASRRRRQTCKKMRPRAGTRGGRVGRAEYARKKTRLEGAWEGVQGYGLREGAKCTVAGCGLDGTAPMHATRSCVLDVAPRALSHVRPRRSRGSPRTRAPRPRFRTGRALPSKIPRGRNRTWNLFPTCPQQPNVYLEPKWPCDLHASQSRTMQPAPPRP